jgi:hypothetical protein
MSQVMATLDQMQHWKQHYNLRVDLTSVQPACRNKQTHPLQTVEPASISEHTVIGPRHCLLGAVMMLIRSDQFV